MTLKQIEEMNRLAGEYKKLPENNKAVVNLPEELKKSYEAGYKAAMEKAKVLEDALDWYAQTGDGAYSQAHLYLRAKAALKEYRGEGC